MHEAQANDLILEKTTITQHVRDIFEITSMTTGDSRQGYRIRYQGNRDNHKSKFDISYEKRIIC